WRKEQSDWQGLGLNQPLIAFTTSPHPGALGKVFSFLHLNNNRLRVLALKKAEHSDEVILRLVEMDGQAQRNVQITFASPVIAAREVDGQEMPLTNATVMQGVLVTSFDPYQLRTFAVKVRPSPASATVPRSQVIQLPFNRTIGSKDGMKATSGF